MVELLDGKKEIIVQPGTQNGDKICLKSKV